MRFHKDGHEARRVDVEDYDRLCDLAAWCGGKPIDDGEWVMTMPTPLPGEVTRVKDGAWIIRDSEGVFYVYPHPEWRPMVDGWPWFLTRANE